MVDTLFRTEKMLRMKHFFDYWRYASIMNDLVRSNIILNVSCEQMHMHCDKSAIECDLLVTKCAAAASECDTIKQHCSEISRESERVLTDLIDIKLKSAEQAFLASRQRLRQKNDSEK